MLPIRRIGQVSLTSLTQVQRAMRAMSLKGALHTSAVLGEDKKDKDGNNLAAMTRPDLGASPLFDFGSSDKETSLTNDTTKGTELLDQASMPSKRRFNKDTKVTAQTDNFRYSHQKLRFLASQVAQTKVSDALKQLEHHPRKKAAKHVFSALLHAQREASRHHGIKNDEAYIEQAWVGKGAVKKKIKYHGRGRMGQMTLPTSHMKVIIGRAPRAEDADAGIARRRAINGWVEKKKVWTALVDKPIYNPKPYYNW